MFSHRFKRDLDEEGRQLQMFLFNLRVIRFKNNLQRIN
jgi:hypothetical protein